MTITGSVHSCKVTMSVLPLANPPKLLILDSTRDSAANISLIHPRYMSAIEKGVKAAIAHGPKLGYPVINVCAKLHWFEISRGTSESIVTAAICKCIKKVKLMFF